jgi:hypothetical protein
MTIYNIYDQVADLIASLPADKIMALQANKDMQNRFNYLVDKVKSGQIDSHEKDELDHFIVLERLIRLAKIRAQQPLSVAAA